MPLWTLTGLTEGRATTRWPGARDTDGQEGVLGLPLFAPEACAEGCSACVDVCPTGALVAGGGGPLSVDYGRCIGCQLCVEACPTGAARLSEHGDYAATERGDLILSDRFRAITESQARPGPNERFGRSLHIRHVDAGSCNGCESELQALNNPFYNLHRFGIFFTASPRHADLLLVTGPVTEALREPLIAAHTAMPTPKWVMAVGSCAVSGALTGGDPTGGSGVSAILPVDIFLPGSPPNPAAIISALLLLLGRMPQRVKGGRHD